MRAVVYEGPYRVRVREKPVPAIAHADDVILKVTRAAICGSDLNLFHGLVPDTRVGMTFGHEFTGVVEEAGPGVRSLRRGDRVVVPFNIACGTCFYCRRGLTADCEASNPANELAGGVFGYSHTTGGYDGGQAEYVHGWMGYAVDAGAEARPGVPRERPLPAVPARGLSGFVRRAAYRVPEHRPSRWVLLLAADRVDVVEHRVAAGWWVIPALAALAGGYLLAARLTRR